MTAWFSLARLFGGGTPEIWPPPQVEETFEEEEEELPALSPVAGPIHVLSGSALVRIDNGVLRVERPDLPPAERPVELVSAVHIHGWATITSPCVAALVRQGTPVVWRGATGYPIAWAAPMHQPALETRRAQYAAAGTLRALEIARALVSAKIANMRGLIRRRARLPARDGLGALQRHAAKARHASSLETLLGIEGAATALYFSSWPQMLSLRAGELSLESDRAVRRAMRSMRFFPIATPFSRASASAHALQRPSTPGRDSPSAAAGTARPRAGSHGAVPAADRRPGGAVGAE